MSTQQDYEREDAAAILATVATAGAPAAGGVPPNLPEEKPPALGEFYREYPPYEQGGEQGYYGYDSRYYYGHEHQDAPPPHQGHPHPHAGGHPYEEYSTDREYAQYNPYRPRGGPPPPREGAAQYPTGPPPRPYYEDQYYYADRYPPREGEYHRAPPTHAHPTLPHRAPSYEEYPQQEYYRGEYRYDDPSRDRRRPPPPQVYPYPPPHQQPHYRHDQHQLDSPSYDSQEQFRRGPPHPRTYSDEYGHYERYDAEYHSQHRPPHGQPYYPPYGGRTYSQEEKEAAASTKPPAQAPSQHQAQEGPGGKAPSVASQTGPAQSEEKVPKPQFNKEDPKKSQTNAAAPSEKKEEPKDSVTNKKDATKIPTEIKHMPSPSQPMSQALAAKLPHPTPGTTTSSSVCTCKKSRCLKLYCQCFSTNSLCNPLLCRCDGCYNTAEHVNARRHAMRTILQRNPGAFRSKFVPAEAAAAAAEEEKQDSATHKNGCKCRKSACLKKYCECFNADTKCGPNCRCLGCKNLPVGMVDRGYRGDGKGGWMMDAARDLAYLKHGSSPHHPPHRPPYPPHLYHRSITESPPKQPMRHPPLYPPPPQQYYPSYPPPPQLQHPPQQARAEQTPPRTTGSFNNDDSPSGLAVNTLLMAAYAMTELDGKKKEDGEKAGEKKENSVNKDDAEKSDEKKDKTADKNGAEKADEKNMTADKDDKGAEEKSVDKEASVPHGFGSSPMKAAPSQTNDSVESSQNNVASAPTKDTAESFLNSVYPESDAPSQSTKAQKETTVDTCAPPIEKLPSHEITPNNLDEKTRKRTHTDMEEECPSSFNPPSRAQNGKNDTKVDLFRKPSESNGLPLPERNVSSDSDDVTAEKSVELKEPPAKRAAVETRL